MMRSLTYTGIAIVMGVLCSTALVSSAHALTAQTYDPSSTKKSSDIIISRHSFQVDGVHYVQLFNNSSKLHSLEGWKLVYHVHFSDDPDQKPAQYDVPLKGLLEPYNYLLISGLCADQTPCVDSSDEVFKLNDPAHTVGDSIELVPAESSGVMGEKIDLDLGKKTGVWRRNLSSTSNNSYTSTYKEYDSSDDDYKNLVLYGHGLYRVPSDPGLRVSAVMARANSCSPQDTSLGCHDYVKFYNPTSGAVDLSNFMLHYGSSVIDHKVELAGTIKPKAYHIVDSSAAGSPIALTNSGGFIWLSDVYNLEVYESSMFEYPSMSSTAKIGFAWAQKSDEVYAWTNILTAGANTFPKNSSSNDGSTSNLKPCAANQYRSTETNRCRLKNPSGSSLVPCKPGQYRSTETNRCRSSTTASTSLKPCASNQYRNPETNRCRLKSTSQ